MKTKALFAFLAFFGLFILQACDDDLLDITENFKFTHEFTVDSDESVFAMSEVVNLAEKVSVIDDYGNKIKSIEIQKVNYWLKAFDGPQGQTLTNGVLSVANADGSDIKIIATLQDVVLEDLLNNKTELPVNADGIDKLANRIKNPPHTFSFSLTGVVDEEPLDFTVAFEFEVKMVANPL